MLLSPFVRNSYWKINPESSITLTNVNSSKETFNLTNIVFSSQFIQLLINKNSPSSVFI